MRCLDCQQHRKRQQNELHHRDATAVGGWEPCNMHTKQSVQWIHGDILGVVVEAFSTRISRGL